jgi:hypothetical protein
MTLKRLAAVAIVCAASWACQGNDVVECGGIGDPDCPPPTTTPSGRGSHENSGDGAAGWVAVSVSDAGVDADEASASEAGADGGSVVIWVGDAGADAPDASSGLCSPGVVCDGIASCDNECFTSACCVLYCACSDGMGISGTLVCTLSC